MAADYHWDEIKGGTFQCCFQLRPAYPTRTLCRGNNRSPPSVLSCSWATLAGLTQLAVLRCFSSGPKKTPGRINQQPLPDEGQHLAVVQDRRSGDRLLQMYRSGMSPLAKTEFSCSPESAQGSRTKSIVGACRQAKLLRVPCGLAASLPSPPAVRSFYGPMHHS